MTRYNSALVTLHWLMAIMIFLALVAGGLILDNMPNDSPDKAGGLAGHMAVGSLIGVLLIVRLIVRLTTAKPTPASTGNPLLDRLGALTHWAFYLCIAGMVLSGLATAIGADLLPIAYGGSGATIPAMMEELPQRALHGLFAITLVLLIGLHIAGALYHQFVLKDGLMRRMGFGKQQ